MSETQQEFPSGFDAMGKTVPEHRLSNAYNALKQMNPEIRTEDAMKLIGMMASAIERDQPYEAQQHAREYAYNYGGRGDEKRHVLDETGVLRLFATLLAG